MRIINMAFFCCLMLLCVPINNSRACTNFCLDTSNGPIFGCNLDLLIPGDGLIFINQRGIAKKGLNTTGEIARWVSKYGSVTFNLAGREFAFGGMNEAGLVIGNMELLDSKFPEPDERAPLSIGTWAQYVLDNCSNVREAIEVDKYVRIEDSAPPSHFLIADAKGNCAAIEWLDGKFVCHTGETLPVKAMSNSIYDQALSIYKRGGPRWWESDRGLTSERFAKAAKRNAAHKTSGESNKIKYAFETLTHIVAVPHTKWNIVYNIPERQVFFRSAASPTLKYLTLSAFNLSCTAPLLMLDVNTADEGNVEKSFKPYDRSANLTVFQNLCDRYEIKITSEAAADIMNLFETFECSH